MLQRKIAIFPQKCPKDEQTAPKLINQSDIVISRAGASTLSEMAICGKPCIFIPLPNTLDGDQEHNARNFELANAAIVCDQKYLNPINNIILLKYI